MSMIGVLPPVSCVVDAVETRGIGPDVEKRRSIQHIHTVYQ